MQAGSNTHSLIHNPLPPEKSFHTSLWTETIFYPVNHWIHRASERRIYRKKIIKLLNLCRWPYNNIIGGCMPLTHKWNKLTLVSVLSSDTFFLNVTLIRWLLRNDKLENSITSVCEFVSCSSWQAGRVKAHY